MRATSSAPPTGRLRSGNVPMKEEPPEARAQLLHLSDEIQRIAGSLAQLSIGAGRPLRQDFPCSNLNNSDVLLERVVWLIRARQSRARYLPGRLFTEPAWEMLLDLLRAELTHERITVSSACIAAGVPATTGLRWLKTLVDEGLVLREYDLTDGRRTFVALSPGASDALRRYFLEVVGTPRADP